MAGMSNLSKTILLIRPGVKSHRAANPAANRLAPLSLRYCGALLEAAGYDVVEMDGFVSAFTPAGLANWAGIQKPLAAIFSIERFQHSDLNALFELTKAIKSHGAKTIAFGPFPTHYPDGLLGKDRFDAVMLGEPEATVLKAVDAVLNGKSPASVATKSGQIKRPAAVKNVDELPFPLRRTADTTDYYCNYPLPMNRKAVWGSMIAGRGCSRACTFCSPFDRITYSKKVRPRNLESVAAEARELASMGVNVISFEDDDPTFSKERTLGLADALAPVPAKYICHARVDELDAESIKALADSGCAMIKLGVESGSARIIDRLKKGDGASWVERTQEVAALASEFGMAVCGLFIAGCPGETEDDLSETRRLIMDTPFDLIQLHYFTPYPGSAINAKGPALDENTARRLHHYDSKTLKRMPFSELSHQDLVKWAGAVTAGFIARPGFVAGHLKKFAGFYLHNYEVLLRLTKGVLTRP